MWWLFGHRSQTGYGNQVAADCPHCQSQTPCQEIVTTETASVWFVPVSQQGRVVGYRCLNCGNEFEAVPPISIWGVVKLVFAAVVVIAIVRACFCG